MEVDVQDGQDCGEALRPSVGSETGISSPPILSFGENV
jgi:hypothetical protein